MGKSTLSAEQIRNLTRIGDSLTAALGVEPARPPAIERTSVSIRTNSTLSPAGLLQAETVSRSLSAAFTHPDGPNDG